ncbi:MAG: OmpA family protein [Sulfuricurvum sp.]|uniref:OmpA family protein n=1 Tax=Sulfuricurvum sp. TaxID=2025608 RepID=UPI0026385654|nr:OmpA family protein [Sulfuricurvum sp.]MDD2828991.1 OmpA family protein [Sulfuricurvum sp.]MDD4950090.1 OmpA family protein [Sulfuricurvum sp.]
MFHHPHKSAKALSVIALFVFAVQASAIDQHCIDRHEYCPEQYKKTTYSTTYQEINKEKATPVAVTTPPVTPIPAPIVAQVPLDDDHDGIINTLDACPNTPSGYKVDSKGCPKSVTLHINFAFASNIIPSSADKDIEKLITFMQESPACTISIVGHTDIIGTDARNQPRSEARAKALADKLIASGINSTRIQSSGKGSKEPIATNTTDEGRAQNRRLEVTIK